MSLDHLVTADFASLASDRRRDPRAVDQTLRAIANQPRATELAMLALGGVFARRVARAAAGAMLVLATGVLLAVSLAGLELPQHHPDRSGWLLLFEGGPKTIACLLLALAIATHAIASRVASRRFLRVTGAARDPVASAGLLVRRADAPAVLFGIAGATVFAVVIGVAWFTLGSAEWMAFFTEGEYIGTKLTSRLRDCAIAATVVIGLATVLARALPATRRRLLEHWSVLAAGLVIGIVTLYIGFVHDAGPVQRTMHHPSQALRGTLTATGTLAVFLVVTWLALRRRRLDMSSTQDACEEIRSPHRR